MSSRADPQVTVRVKTKVKRGLEMQNAAVRVELVAVCADAGSTVYTCMLNKRGGVEADLTVSAIEPGSGAGVHDPAFQGNLQANLLQRCVANTG